MRGPAIFRTSALLWTITDEKILAISDIINVSFYKPKSELKRELKKELEK
jgi:hypothetical protein